MDFTPPCCPCSTSVYLGFRMCLESIFESGLKSLLDDESSASTAALGLPSDTLAIDTLGLPSDLKTSYDLWVTAQALHYKNLTSTKISKSSVNNAKGAAVNHRAVSPMV